MLLLKILFPQKRVNLAGYLSVSILSVCIVYIKTKKILRSGYCFSYGGNSVLNFFLLLSWNLSQQSSVKKPTWLLNVKWLLHLQQKKNHTLIEGWMLHSFRLTHQVLIHELYYLLRGF